MLSSNIVDSSRKPSERSTRSGVRSVQKKWLSVKLASLQLEVFFFDFAKFGDEVIDCFVYLNFFSFLNSLTFWLVSSTVLNTSKLTPLTADFES